MRGLLASDTFSQRTTGESLILPLRGKFQSQCTPYHAHSHRRLELGTTARNTKFAQLSAHRGVNKRTEINDARVFTDGGRRIPRRDAKKQKKAQKNKPTKNNHQLALKPQLTWTVQQSTQQTDISIGRLARWSVSQKERERERDWKEAWYVCMYCASVNQARRQNSIGQVKSVTRLRKSPASNMCVCVRVCTCLCVWEIELPT